MIDDRLVYGNERQHIMSIVIFSSDA